MKTWVLIKRFLPYFKNYRRLFVLDLLCAALTTLCEIVLPLIVRFITNTAISDASQLTAEAILRCGFLYIILRIIDSAAAYFMTSMGHYAGAAVETEMRRDLFAHLQQLSFSYFSHTKVGQIMARITSDLFEITEFAHHCPEEFLIAAIKGVVSFVIIARVNLWLALVIFAALPVMLVVASHFNHKMRAGMKDSRQQVGEINAQVEDSLLGIRVVKSFTNEAYEEHKFAQGNQVFLKMKKQIYRAMAGLTCTTRSFDGLMYILVVMLGGFLLMDGKITPGDFVLALLYVSMLLTTVRRLVDYAEQFQKGTTGIERFFEIMDAPFEIKDSPDAKELTDVQGDIKFEHVSFHYPDEPETEVLQDISLHIRPGDNVALVGPSGAGKTTLCNLIPRFYEATGGRILVDDRDIRSLTLKSLRSNIGMVQQDVYLFAGSVAENIIYGKPGATMEEVVEAAKKANAHDFIMELPQGYETYIGERGVRLS
ncbi:MAG: ABC transporter ATP-binding protein, partial [Clostridiales bacterium]|nr:ABC transporter ATP-binding protein [Clostridiales bacterium]